MRPDSRGGPLLLVALVLGMPSYGFADCETAVQLQSMAKEAFRSQRGTPQEDDPERYESRYRMAGAYECLIFAAKESDLASLTCTWRLVRGVQAQAEAKSQFEKTVAAFEACLSKAHRRKRYNGNGEVAEFEPKPLAGSLMPLHSLNLSYAFYGPWWELELEYQVAKE